MIDVMIRTPEEILQTPHRTTNSSKSIVMRDGVELEKGVVLTPRKIEDKIDLIKKYCWYWSVYPDRLN